MDIRNFFNSGGSARLKPTESVPKNVPEKSDSNKRKSHADYDKIYDKKRHRTVLQSWLQSYPWLKASEDSSVAWCNICRKYPKFAEPGSNFVKDTGLSGDSLRLTAVKTHDGSRKHKDCVGAELATTNPSATPIAKCFVRLTEEQHKNMSILFNTAYHCVKQELSFTKYASILDLQNKNGLSFGQNYRSDVQARHFISHIAAVEVGALKEKVSNARFITVMADGSTDVTIKEEEIVYVRYVHEGNPKTNFVSIVEAEHADATGVLAAINKGLEVIGESCTSQKLICLNLDGAAVNMGSKSGVGAQVKKEIPHLAVIHCVVHNFELAIADSVKLSPYLKGKFDETVKGILKIYQYSPKLRRELSEIASYLDTAPAHLGKLKQVRWLSSQQRALTAIEKNWHIIVMHLEQMTHSKNENSQKAVGYLREIKSTKFLRYLYQMLDILDILTPLSRKLQSDETLLVDLCDSVTAVLLQLQELQRKSGPHYDGFVANMQNKTYKDVALRGPDISDDDYMELADLADNISKCTANRFSNLKQKPAVLFQVFDFVFWPLDKQDFSVFGTEEIAEICVIYKDVLTENEIQNIKKEWPAFKNTVSRLRTGNAANDKLKIYTYLLKNQLEEIKSVLILIELMLCMSPSTAACERGFSSLNRLKTTERNCLRNDTLNDIMRISIDGPCENSFNPNASIEHWLVHTKGTRHTGGHKPHDRPGRASSPDEDSS